MKHLFLAAAFLFSFISVQKVMAQSTDDEIQILQGAWGMEKRDLVSEAMRLSEADSVKFWPIYDKYELERKKLGHDRIRIIDDYMAAYETITSEKADALVNRLFKNDAAYSQLLRQYYGNVKKSLNALEAAKFLHVESYLQSFIKVKVQSNLPFIGDIQPNKENK
jgi:hypothetical protein